MQIPLAIQDSLKCKNTRMFKDQAEVFGLPSWQQKAGICCKCSATLETFTDFTSNAVWRTERYSHWDFLEKLESLDKPRTALCKCPFFTTEVFKLEWLHVADLGCSCDMLGNLLWYVLPKFGGTRQEQLSALWLRMKIYYADCAIQDTIGNLTFGMLRKKSTTSPKLSIDPLWGIHCSVHAGQRHSLQVGHQGCHAFFAIVL